MNFSLIENETLLIWSYGWFNTSRFAVHRKSQHPKSTLKEFVRSTIFQRSFHSKPNLWGWKHETHGPFLTSKFQSDWFRELPIKDLKHAIRDKIESYDFKPRVTKEQFDQIDRWSARNSNCTAWQLNAPPNDPSIRVEFAFIWWAFDEFIIYDDENSELLVAVIGFD